MPYSIRKVRGKSCYRVSNISKTRKNKRVFSKCSSKKNATLQLRLLRALQYNKSFIPYSQMNRRKTSKRSIKRR